MLCTLHMLGCAMGMDFAVITVNLQTRRRDQASMKTRRRYQVSPEEHEVCSQDAGQQNSRVEEESE